MAQHAMIFSFVLHTHLLVPHLFDVVIMQKDTISYFLQVPK